MNAFPIRDNSDLSRAIQLVDALWDAARGSPEAELREVMAERIERFEARALSRVLPPADPRRLIAAKCRELGLDQHKLGERLGWTSAGQVSEVLAGRGRITLDRVRDLERVLAIPAGLLVAEGESTEAGEVPLAQAEIEEAQR